MESNSQALRTALLIAGAFMVTSLVYIGVSDFFAAKAAADAQQLQQIQTVKGFVFVSLVALGLGGLSFFLLRKLEDEWRASKVDREELLSIERHTLVGTLAASIAHDANNLVGAIQANLEFAMERTGDDEDLRDAIADACEAAEGLAKLNTRLRSIAAYDGGDTRTAVVLADLVREAAHLIRTHSKLDGVELELVCDSTLSATVDRELISHAVVNLLLNAGDAIGAAGRVRVTVEEIDDFAVLRVEDDGPGIPLERREAVLRPFETSKPEGTGLGLFSVAYCVDQHAGTLRIDDSELGGALIEIGLPLNIRADAMETPATRPSISTLGDVVAA